MRKLTVAVWQMESKRGDPEANLSRLQDTMASKPVEAADLLVAPEMFLTGFGPDARTHATPENGGWGERVQSVVEDQGLGLATSILTRRAGRDYNTFHLWAPDGKLLGSRDKIHLWDEEANRVTPGDATKPIETPWGRVGGMVCYDVEFPELSRTLALDGADLLIVPAAFYSRTSWDIMTRARALENGCYLVAANQIGGDPTKRHNGMSRIVDPFGHVLAEIPMGREGVLTLELDPDVIAKAREYAPFLRDRRLGVVAPTPQAMWAPRPKGH